jgi:hypothetical protein
VSPQVSARLARVARVETAEAIARMLAGVDVDQARLLPHLRRVGPLHTKADHAVREVDPVAARAWLRGIPVIGTGAGAIVGTDPGRALLAKERRHRN